MREVEEAVERLTRATCTFAEHVDREGQGWSKFRTADVCIALGRIEALERELAALSRPPEVTVRVDGGSSQSQPCGDGSLPILPPASEPSAGCRLRELRDSIAVVPITDSSLSYLATNVFYARGSLGKDIRREAVVAIKTLRSILYAARDPEFGAPVDGEDDTTERQARPRDEQQNPPPKETTGKVEGVPVRWKCNCCTTQFMHTQQSRPDGTNTGPPCPTCKAHGQYTYRDLTHFGDPCVYCGTAHDDVAPGPCPGES